MPLISNQQARAEQAQALSAAFSLADWYWQVGTDQSRYWSSKAGTYVTTLPDNVTPTIIDSEQSLSAVLLAAGLTSPIVTDAQITAERDRRIDAGVVFNGTLFQTRPTDRENIAGAALLATQAIMAGTSPTSLRWASPDRDFVWIALDNSLVPMTAQDVINFGKAAAEMKSALIFKARLLKDTLPEDYTADYHWV